ncbi:C-glycoside deglycosidase beta subunit domain-containing protein [Sinomonas atrocyanea]|uniref:C-glycoside deglycosidase beta subunit domain-containing protein n=1 Tax=Sinomonas atrocyanea TaxID=37927 RepID=UPI0027D90FE1|nr:DUF6379 domain-containing protein [Sinomonas atrocyanea]
MLPERIIDPESFAASGERVRLSIRMPWYRALPLSSVADVQWTVDGAAVPRDSITWTVGGTTRRLDELPPRHDEWWYVLDSAVLEGAAPAGGDRPASDAGEPEHEVAIVLALFIPYITTDFGVLKIEESDRKRMRKKAIA